MRVCAVLTRPPYFAAIIIFIAAAVGCMATLAVVRYTSFASGFLLADDGASHVHIREVVDLSFRPADEKKPEELEEINLTDFWEVWRLIESEYVPKPVRYSVDENADMSADDVMPTDDSESRPDREKLLYGAMGGLARSTGDVYTTFFPPKDTDRFREEVLEGEVDGIIGSYIHMKDGVLTVAKAFKNGPAYAAGLRTGDFILEVNGVKTALYNLDQSVNAIRGPRGTAVTLKVYRPATDDEFELSIVRDLVEIPSVETEVRGDVFVIHLLTFTRKTPAMFRRGDAGIRRGGEGRRSDENPAGHAREQRRSARGRGAYFKHFPAAGFGHSVRVRRYRRTARVHIRQINIQNFRASEDDGADGRRYRVGIGDSCGDASFSRSCGHSRNADDGEGERAVGEEYRERFVGDEDNDCALAHARKGDYQRTGNHPRY